MGEITAQNIEEAKEELKKLFSEDGFTQQKFAEYLQNITNKLHLTKDAAKELTNHYNGLVEAAKEFVNVPVEKAIDEWGKTLSGFGEKIKQMMPGIGDFAIKIAAMSPQLLARTSIPKTFNDIGIAAKGASADLSEAGQSLMKVLDPSGKSGIRSYVEPLLASAEAGKKMELSLVAMAAATGQLSNMIGESGERTDELNKKTAEFINKTTAIADATGVSTEEVQRYVSVIGNEIPSALDDFTNSTEIAGRQISELQAAIQVAAGTGQSFADVQKEQISLYDTMGLTGKPVLEFLARMQTESEALHMPLKFVKQYAEDAAKSFALYADDMNGAANMTQGAINIMNGLGPALQASGLGPQAVSDLVRGVTDGISKMDTAQKAFLSAQTGGPGGLQGAFQIDQMLAEGKIDQVFDKVRQNMMQKLGGPIVTRAEAAASPEAAGQFQKQIMFMMSPAMGGMAKDQAGAVKLLEAMSKGMTTLPNELAGKDAALMQVMDRGSKLQERGNNTLVQIHNATEKVAQLAAIQNAGTIRQMVGSEMEGENAFQRDRERRMRGAVTGTHTDMFKGMGGRTASEILSSPETQDELSGLGRDMKGTASAIKAMVENTLKGNVSPSPGAIGIDSAAAVSFTDRTAGTLAKTGFKSTGQEMKRHGGTVDVAVSTVCTVCQRKIAHDEAVKAINHNDSHARMQNVIGQP